MTTRLIESYDSYSDFNRNTFFTVSYDLLPSNVYLDIPLKNTKENMQKVLELLNFDAVNLKPVFKNWKTKDIKDALLTDDYPFEYLFKSDTQKLVIWLSLAGEELFADILYSITDEKAEKWALDCNHILRTTFGEPKTPTFKILTRNSKAFNIEDVDTGNLKTIDVDKLYNDDFKEIDTIISNSMDEKESGLILLHGAPGTGKTSYIKSLIAKFEKKNFIFIQNEFVQYLLKPDFITFLLRHRDSVLIIEDAEKIIKSRKHSNQGSVVSTILQLTDGLFSDYLNIKIICTFNSGMEQIDKALLRKGRMIANYEFKALNKEKTNALLRSLGFEPSDKELSLADIFRLKQKGFVEKEPNKIGF